MNALNEQHEAWLARSNAEAQKRFLKLTPADSSGTHWRLENSSGETVYPSNGFGAPRSSINGWFLQNPQA